MEIKDILTKFIYFTFRDMKHFLAVSWILSLPLMVITLLFNQSFGVGVVFSLAIFQTAYLYFEKRENEGDTKIKTL